MAAQRADATRYPLPLLCFNPRDGYAAKLMRIGKQSKGSAARSGFLSQPQVARDTAGSGRDGAGIRRPPG
ncbi:hypothetical protein Vlu01_32620 [Micromonospora lutea]|uniref:Uncharacterized protein n=1 Tax=Micromonospora lutea TaxID=419825 RepID=A0ABQ4IY64_9ACTN|nr:hypothetical protein Vlu01_32620 [Micromonospora lutea]